MTSLLIDTSTNDLTVSIAKENQILSLINSKNMKEHSKYALSSIEKLFVESNLKPQDIDKIIVTVGPGSFTGIRIGITIAKTYAWALKKEIIPISSLLTYALGYNEYDYYVVLLDARRNCVYAAIYDKKYNSLMPEQYMLIEDLYNKVNKLSGSSIIIGNIDFKDSKVNPIKIDVLKTIEYCNNISGVNPHSVNPHYLKRVEAEENLAKETI